MKGTFLVLAIVIASMLVVGGVFAENVTTTKVVGNIINIPEKSVVITPPPTPLVWNLDMSNPNENEITLGDVHVVSNCDYTLVIRGSTGGYMIGEAGAAMTFPTLVNAVQVWDGTNFSKIEDTGRTELVIYHGHSGTTDIPIKLRQHLVSADADKINPTIVLSFAAYT